MRRRLRLLLVPILAVALPLVALAAIGYQWLMLDREAAARRTQDAALAEATRLRAGLRCERRRRHATPDAAGPDVPRQRAPGARGQQGLLPAKLPRLVARLVDLVDRGAIGHPNDLVDMEGFIAAAGDLSAGAPLLARLEQSADAVARTVNTAQRLAAWRWGSARA